MAAASTFGGSDLITGLPLRKFIAWANCKSSLLAGSIGADASANFFSFNFALAAAAAALLSGLAEPLGASFGLDR